MHKYFCYKDERGYFCGQKLVSIAALNGLRVALHDRQHFATIQTYDAIGNQLFCPLYADLDHADPSVSLADARYIVYLLQEMTNLIPDIYFSGNKGFHIIIPTKIEGQNPHLIARYFFEYLAKSLVSLDKNVYRNKSMFRLPNSPASKEGYYKVKISRKELMTKSIEEIRELAVKPRKEVINECDISQINDEFLGILEDARNNLPVYQREHLAHVSGELAEEMTFCIQAMIKNPADSGERNRVCQLLARFFKKCGVSIEDALEIMYKEPHWKSYEDTDQGVAKVFRSIWNSKRIPMVGCKTGTDSDLMKQHCDSLCWFNEKRMQIRFGPTNHSSRRNVSGVSGSKATPEHKNGSGVLTKSQRTVTICSQ